MLLNFVELLSLVIFASVMQSNFKIPSPLTFIGAVLALKFFNIHLFEVNDHTFDTLVMITLPILLTTDILKLKWIEIKQNWISLLWVAVIAVILSIGAGALLNQYVITDYHLPLAAVIVLFCTIVATDPVTVSAVFSNFQVPHKLKFLTEGESLFNDATTLVVFSIALVALANPEKISFSFIALQSFKVMGGAIIIGALVGLFTLQALKLSEDPLIEATVILLCAYASYLIAENFHMSGILAIIVSVLIVDKKIQEIISQDDTNVENAEKTGSFSFLKNTITNQANHLIIIKTIDFVAIFAAGALFISIAVIVDFNDLLLHWKEILSVFIASTLIRGVMMLKFAIISNKYSKMQSINKRWWGVLTFAGSKGALSILMVHMIPATFEFKQLFESIVIGNILLSTFIYAGILAFIMIYNKDAFRKEYLEDSH